MLVLAMIFATSCGNKCQKDVPCCEEVMEVAIDSVEVATDSLQVEVVAE